MVGQEYVQGLKEAGWPQEFNEKLTLGDLSSNVGIAVLWTFQDVVSSKLDPKNYCVLGNYYDRKNALEPFVRNCLANPNLRYVILLGNDKAQSREVLVNFFRKGIGEDGKIIDTDVPIPRGIPVQDLEKLRQHVQLFDLTDEIKDLNNSEEYANAINKVVGDLEKRDPYDEPKLYEKPPLETDSYPAERSGFLIRGKNVGETWLKILNEIYSYGKVTKMKVKDSGQVRECVNLMAVVSEEDPDNPKMEEYFRFDKEYLMSYYDEICTDKIPEGTTYTYGSRLRGWEGKEEGSGGPRIDQIQDMIEYLKSDTYRKSAIAQTWIVEHELTRRYLNKDKGSPCIVLVQPNIQDGVLHFTSYIRSNDMFRAWPLNAFGLRKLQKIVADGLGVDMGDLITISSSAHIYQDNWEDTKEIVKEFYKETHCFFDPRGYYTITLKEGKIFVQHYSPDSQLLKEYEGTSAREVNDLINSSQHTLDSYHAGYLGEELMKAEIALSLGLEYVQDSPVDVNGKKFGYVFNEGEDRLNKWDTDGDKVIESADVCDDSCAIADSPVEKAEVKKEEISDDSKSKGLFVVFEGIDGCGKSTQMKKFCNYLFESDKGNNVVMTREPYADVKIRKELKEEGALDNAERFAELFIEDRKNHVNDLINPSIEGGKHVVSDRYKHSTLAYQSAQGMDLSGLIEKHNGLPVPDVTFIVNVSPEVAFERMNKESRDTHKFEENKEFLGKVRDGFINAKDALKDEKVFVIDGDRSAEEIFNEVKGIFRGLHGN